ncbi:MAG: sulfate adenylyltransferase subunit CysD [Pseudomonadota bacterium]
MTSLPPYLAELEAEAIYILRDGLSEATNPVILFSGGKDSTVLAELAVRAFAPARPPLPLLHVDSSWEFPEVLAFRDAFAERHGFKLIAHRNEDGVARGLNPIEHGDVYTTVMRTDALKQALDLGGYDVIFGGARRDEERTRAKERIVSVREPGHGWEPRRQRPELWNNFNWRMSQGQSLRVFPLSNWTEADLWTYILLRDIPLVPLYFAKERPIITVDGVKIVLPEGSRFPGGTVLPIHTESVRFRTLGCWPVTGAIASQSEDLEGVIRETLLASHSEREGRVSDSGSLEAQKRSGYF